MPQVQKLTVKGYKSIKSLVDFELRALNVLIGANGAGKSNLISLFRFLSSVVSDSFQLDVQKAGGVNAILHGVVKPHLIWKYNYSSHPRQSLVNLKTLIQ
jgi:predicted ATPase